MNIPTRNLSKAPLDGLSGLAEPANSPGVEEVGRRAQEILKEWLGFYFSGDGFNTPGPGGSIEQKNLEPCQILFGQTVPDQPSAKPILHVLLADRRDDDGTPVSGGLMAFRGEWVYNTLVRVSAQLPAASNPAGNRPVRKPANVCRRVADQFAWLLRSAHTQDIVFKGLGSARVVNGPRAIQAGSWHLMQIVWSVRVQFHAYRNDPS